MTMKQKQQPLAITPGKGLGFLLLGASLRDIVVRLKAQSDVFPRLKIQHSATRPATEPINVLLPDNGLRLRFDGPDQRLRLVEVLDLSRIPLTYKGQDLVKLQDDTINEGPSFRHVYSKLFGPTFEGEHFTSPQGSSSLYILSYPGIAFSFKVPSWSEGSDFVSVLSSPQTSPAQALSIFSGSSWKEARTTLYTRPCPHPRSLALVGRTKELIPDEIELAVIKGKGHVEFRRRTLPPFSLRLGETTPQDLILMLGPPDAIYRKNDRRLSIHKNKAIQHDSHDLASSPDTLGGISDTDRSSISTITDYSNGEDEALDSSDPAAVECFYNYFSHGFDIFISYPHIRSPPLVPSDSDSEEDIILPNTTYLVATKILLHANIPSSHSFNRHRRSRWIIDSAQFQPATYSSLTSETPFREIQFTLNEIWQETFSNDRDSRMTQRYMVLSRGWGDSPGSSIELLGGWESADSVIVEAGNRSGGEIQPSLGNTELYGWPGLLFEVLKNDTVSCITIY